MLQVTSGKIKKPILMAVFGVESIGKTEFATKFPSPLFIDFEGGSESYDVDRIRPSGYFEVKEFLTNYSGEHKTIIIDSLDWLERAMYKDMCAKAKVETVEDLGGYGKWVNVVLTEFSSFVDVLKNVRLKNINIVMTAHYQIKTFNDPITAAGYDRYTMKLHDKVGALIREWVDMVLFANFQTYSKVNKGETKGKGIGNGLRMFYTEKRPSHDAKNRFSLPYEMPMDYDTLMSYINESKEDTLANLQAEITGLLLDVKDAQILKSATEFFEKNKTDINQLHAVKNRLMVITGA